MSADSTTVFVGWEERHATPVKENLKMQSKRIRLFALILGLTMTTIPAWLNSAAQEHKVINLAPARGLPFNDGVIAGNTLYIAGQEGTDDAGKLAPGGVAAETKAALGNIEKVVKAAGYELNDIVSVTVYLADIHDFPEMNKVYRSVLPDPKPARATIQAAGLVNDARVEISAIAVKQK
jgi:2-iminobutanoate/2-iminopropanoate deaminase